MNAQPIRFLLVGAGGYIVNVAVFAALYAVRTPYAPAAAGAYLIANALMYLGNRYFTFRLSHDGLLRAYARYALVGLVIAALNAGLLVALVEGPGLGPRIGQALSLVLLTPVAFVLIKRWALRVAR